MHHWGRLVLTALILFALGRTVLHAQGPPYQTDDPVPVDFQHYEFYIFGNTDGTPVEVDSVGPAFEFNWGALPRLQLHGILPWGSIHPSDDQSAFGLIDMELGAKIAIIKESKHMPQIGPFVMFEIPTGNYDRGLSIGKVNFKIPMWLQKNEGKWLFDGGVGYAVVPRTDYRNYWYTGWLIKRQLSERLELGAEVFGHQREGDATPQTEGSTLIDVGGYYHFKKHPGQQFLFAYGHSIAGQTENYAYVGMYWTWGKGGAKPDTTSLWLHGPHIRNGF